MMIKYWVSRKIELTSGSGVSACWHITHGTPVSRDVAIAAAQFTYGLAPAP